MFTEQKCIACGTPFSTPVLADTGVLCRDCKQQGLFRKQIIVTGITRMNDGHVCVSGIDPQTMRFVRPVFHTGLSRDFAMDGSSQVIRHFNLIELELRKYCPSKGPHTEDWLINEQYAPRFVRHLTDTEVLQVLNYVAVNDLDQALAPQNRSLFIVRAQQIVDIWHEHYEKFKVRVSFIDQAGNFFQRVPVTDLLTLAFVRYQLAHGNRGYASELKARFNANPYRFVRVGLTRKWRGEHWKQVTALVTMPDLFAGRTFSYYERCIGEVA